MPDLENMLEATENTDQPDATVVEASEETTPPQGGDIEAFEYVEGEDDQVEKSNDDALMKQRAAFAKSKQKARDEKEKREKAEKESRELRERLEKLESQQASIQKGSPPTYESCDYDEELYQQKTREYYLNEKKEDIKDDKPKASASSPVLNEESEFYHFQKANDLREKLSNYDDLESKAKNRFSDMGLNADVVVNEISTIAMHKGLDVAKAIASFGMNQNLVDELKKAAATGNQFAIADVIEKASNKIKPRSNKKIDSRPEHGITSSGPIDNKEAAIKKALDKYAETGKIEDFKALQAARKN